MECQDTSSQTSQPRATVTVIVPSLCLFLFVNPLYDATWQPRFLIWRKAIVPLKILCNCNFGNRTEQSLLRIYLKRKISNFNRDEYPCFLDKYPIIGLLLNASEKMFCIDHLNKLNLFFKFILINNLLIITIS